MKTRFLSPIDSLRVVVMAGLIAFLLILSCTSFSQAQDFWVDCPSIETNKATNVTRTSITLNGTLKDLGDIPAAAVWFEWGIDITYGNETEWQAMTSTGTFSIQLTDLDPGTTYHFRASAMGHCRHDGDDIVSRTLAGIIYVNSDAGPGGDGSSWDNAFDNLQNALDDVNNVGIPCEIWVASGTYTPSSLPATDPPASAVSEHDVTAFTSHEEIDIAYPGTQWGECPAVTVTNTSNISENAVTLNGNLDDMGSAVEVCVWFEWGTTTSYGNTTASQTLTSNGPFSTYLTGLDCDTTYYYRAVAEGDCLVYSPESTYVTSACGGGPVLYYDLVEVIDPPQGGSVNLNPVSAGNEYVSGTVVTLTADANESYEFQNWSGDLNGDSNPTTITMTSDKGMTANFTLLSGSPVNRNITFQMKNGVGIYGGFPNTGSPTWNDRNGEMYNTVLSGEIGNPTTTSDNCFHVFYHPDHTDLDNTAILDGFIIAGGNADGGSPRNVGGGMVNIDSSPAIRNCTFTGNSGRIGGAMYNRDNSSPIIANCTFIENIAKDDGGGGMSNGSNSSPVITDCIFSGNSAKTDGGGMSNWWFSSPVITNCTFSGNLADNGGGMYNCNNSSPVITNCTFYGNSATSNGGVMSNWLYSLPVLTNCTFAGNSAGNGNGIYNEYSSPVITNCILWNDTPYELDNRYSSSNPVVTYCNVQVKPGAAIYEGTGNICGTPMFINPGSGDFHLMPSSPCIDSGNNSAPMLPEEDFEGDPRIINSTVDMGVDEAPVWTCMACDNDQSGKIEYGEVVTGLMEFLDGKIRYSQMVEVLMCYLTG